MLCRRLASSLLGAGEHHCGPPCPHPWETPWTSPGILSLTPLNGLSGTRDPGQGWAGLGIMGPHGDTVAGLSEHQVQR